MSDKLNWRTVELVLEGAVFLVMGLELKEIVRANGAREEGIWHGVWLAAAALGIVLVVRAAYVSLLVWLQTRRARVRQRTVHEMTRRLDHATSEPPAAAARRGRGPGDAERRMDLLRRRVRTALADIDYYNASPLGWKHGTVIVWAGMRGVVTLAAAQTLPHDAPERALLVFVAFLVAVGSLMLQGFTLPGLVRMLRIDPPDESVDRAQQKRLDDELRAAAASALAQLTHRRDGTAYPAELTERVAARLTHPLDEDETGLTRDLLELRIATVEAMRTRLNELASGGGFSSQSLRHALAELDADQLSLELRLQGEDS